MSPKWRMKQGEVGQWSSCPEPHPGTTPLFRLRGKRLYGAASMDYRHWGPDLVIDLCGAFGAKVASGFVPASVPNKFAGLAKHMAKTEVLRLMWEDATPPPVPLAFWEELFELLPTTTVVGCAGGHGRTGTALASLLVASGEEEYRPILLVREKHCKEAVETQSQEDYILGLRGRQSEQLEKYLEARPANPPKPSKVKLAPALPLSASAYLSAAYEEANLSLPLINCHGKGHTKLGELNECSWCNGKDRT